VDTVHINRRISSDINFFEVGTAFEDMDFSPTSRLEHWTQILCAKTLYFCKPDTIVRNSWA